MRTQLPFQPFILLLTICLLSGLTTTAQSRDRFENNPEFNFHKKTPLVFSVDPKTNNIIEIFLKRENVENQLYQLKADCYRCEYYLGTVEGNIKIRDNKIVKGKKSKFTIHTEDNLMSGLFYFPGNQYQPGTSYILAGMKTRVISNQQGKFIVEID